MKGEFTYLDFADDKITTTFTADVVEVVVHASVVEFRALSRNNMVLEQVIVPVSRFLLANIYRKQEGTDHNR